MRRSHDSWLKCFGAVAVVLIAVPVSAQVLTPRFRLVASGDRFVAAGEADESEPQRVDYWIGVRCTELPPLLQAQLDLPDGQGVLVDHVVPESPAAQAGLKVYDVIAAVDGTPIADTQALAAAVGRVGDREVKIEYLRAGRKQTLAVKPAPRPDSLTPSEQDQRSIRRWIEQLGHGAGPMNFRMIHPGRVLPPGASLAPPLPNDMTVTIEKEGDKPAKITAKQGDKTWEATEGSLDKLPPEARQFAERGLGFGGFNFDFFEPAPGSPTPPRSFWPPNRQNQDSRFDINKRLDDLNRQIEELRKSVEKMQRD